ncbi:DUF2812 domain-containing protein [Rossellomorea sp. NPDC071047]|uniref:DUF2812 domain-containing protein n=1 Tax=Rossellomorea sp. NPDC071047 TaxID=3390675 RepID=UPI003CFC90F7
MIERKFVPRWGTTFKEKDIKKIEAFARKGWRLENASFIGFTLKRGKSDKIHYFIDYETDPHEEYFSNLQTSGWEHVCSVKNYIHFFAAPTASTLKKNNK